MKMHNSVKEALCASCGHREICAKRQELVSVEMAVDSLAIATGHVDDSDGVLFVRDMPWLTVALQCSHRISGPYIGIRGDKND